MRAMFNLALGAIALYFGLPILCQILFWLWIFVRGNDHGYYDRYIEAQRREAFSEATPAAARPAITPDAWTPGSATAAPTPSTQAEIDALPHPKTLDDLKNIKSGQWLIDLDGKMKPKP